MKMGCRNSGSVFALLLLLIATALIRAKCSWAAEVTLKGSMVCNGACIADPKDEDHVMVIFAIDGTREVREEVDKIVKDFYPDDRLDADAAQKLMDQFSARLKAGG